MVDERSSRTTIYDVARAARVSPATVSKVLNGRGSFRTETRQRVVAAARRLRFRPSLIARDPEFRDSLMIGVLTADSYGRFTIPLMLGAEDAFGPGKISVLMCDARDDPIREEYYLRFLLHRRVDGVIVTGKTNDPRPSLGRDLPFPVLYAYQPSEDRKDCSIVPDNLRVASLAVEHLVQTGRRRIAHVTGPMRTTVVRERIEGAHRALARHGLALALPELDGEWSERWGREAAGILLASGAGVDGVFCASDEIARGVVTGLREAGVRVPGQVGVVGVDNWVVLAEASRPPLTTIDLELRELGVTAARMLADSIRGLRSLPRGVHAHPGRLVVREST